MKYKVGDKVKIREDLKVGTFYGGCLFVLGMRNLVGKTVRITEVSRTNRYCIDLPPNVYWTEEMFECKVDSDVSIYVEGNQVIAIRAETGKRGVARCHPDDTFDFYTGAKIALERLEENEKPYAWLKEGATYYIPVVAFATLYDMYTYTADDWDKRAVERGIVFKTREEAIACAKKMLKAIKQEG